MSACVVMGVSLTSASAEEEPSRPVVTQEECPEQVTEPGASCGRVEVPRDYANPGGEKISVGFVKASATKPEKRRGVLFMNPGGPGESVYDRFTTGGDYYLNWPQGVREEWDIVAVQPRGLQGSTPLRCGVDTASLSLTQQLTRSGGIVKDGCDAKMPGYAAAINTENTASDWEQVRRALGEEKISVYGMSYGTFLGSMYATKYPEHTDKVVLDSGFNPSATAFEQVKGYRNAFNDFFGWVAQHDDTYHLGTTPRQVYRSWAMRIRDESGTYPTAPPPPAAREDLPSSLRFTGRLGTNAATMLGGPNVQVKNVLKQVTHPSARQSTSSTLIQTISEVMSPNKWPELAQHIADPISVANESGMQQPQNTSPDDPEAMAFADNLAFYSMINCNDKPFPFRLGHAIGYLWQERVLGDPINGSRLGEASGLMCAGITAEHPARPLSGEKLAVKPLQIQATGDPATPYWNFGDMASRMGSHVLTVEGPGHVQTGRGIPAVDAAVVKYLRGEEVTETTVPGLHPTPER